jgi:hypothetical protein
MRIERFAILSALVVAFLLSGCLRLGRDKIATYQKDGGRYVTELTAATLGMAHDPISLLGVGSKPFKINEQFDVPRIEGKIDGKEILSRGYGYVGTTLIRDGKMTVSLSIDHYDFHRLDPVEWNGRFTLVEEK